MIGNAFCLIQSAADFVNFFQIPNRITRETKMAISTTANQFDTVNSSERINNTSELTRPLRWIGKGIKDFREAPALSLLYGFLFALACGGVYSLISSVPWFSLAYLTGLVFLGPFLAAGLYAASRDMERGNKPSISSSLRLIYRRRTYLALFSLMLTLVMAVWIRFSSLLFAVKFSTVNPSIEAYTSMLTGAGQGVVLGYFVGIGLLLSVVVFVLSAISIPYILDKNVDFISAMQRSLKVIVENPLSMSAWAFGIALLTALGVATAFIAFLVIFPVLGYATWHSYRELVM